MCVYVFKLIKMQQQAEGGKKLKIAKNRKLLRKCIECWERLQEKDFFPVSQLCF